MVEGAVSVGRIVGSGTASLQRVHSGQHENLRSYFGRPGSPEIITSTTLHTEILYIGYVDSNGHIGNVHST